MYRTITKRIEGCLTVIILYLLIFCRIVISRYLRKTLRMTVEVFTEGYEWWWTPFTRSHQVEARYPLLLFLVITWKFQSSVSRTTFWPYNECGERTSWAVVVYRGGSTLNRISGDPDLKEINWGFGGLRVDFPLVFWTFCSVVDGSISVSVCSDRHLRSYSFPSNLPDFNLMSEPYILGTRSVKWNISESILRDFNSYYYDCGLVHQNRS